MSVEDDIFAEGNCADAIGLNCIPAKCSSINRSLEIMDIKCAVDQNCLVFCSPGHHSRTSWHIANTASSRTKALASELATDTVFRDRLVKELQELFQSSQSEFDCNILLSPLLTKDLSTSDELDDLISEEDQSDVLILFGSPASAFQLLLSIPCLQPQLLDLLLEAVSNGSSYSLRLISQLLRPVGISAFFTTFTSLGEVLSRLIELIKVVDGQPIKSYILQVLPELLASPVENPQGNSNSEVVTNTIQKIIELLDSAFLSTNGDQLSHILVTEIIECANHFPLQGLSLDRLKGACKDVITRSTGTQLNRKCVANVIRSLFASELKKCFSSEEICEFVSLLRCKMRLSEIMAESNEEISSFLDALSLVFRSNSEVKFEWLSYLHRGYSKGGVDCGLLIDDLLILLLACDSETALGDKFGNVAPKRRKEYPLIVKTFNFVAERITDRETHESFSKYSAIFQHKQLYCPLLTLTNQLMTMCRSPVTPRFAYLVYSSVFQSSLPGAELPKQVITDLCKNIHSLAPSASIFEKKRVVRNNKLTINLLLQLSTKFAQTMSPFSDLLLGLLEEVSRWAEESPPDLVDVRKLFVIPAKIAFGGTGETYLQDDLLISIRRLLLNCSSKMRAIGLIGAVTVLEMLCKRQKRPKSRGPVNSTPCSQAGVMECSQSSVLASQVVMPLASQATGSPNNTFRSSHSHFSLKGPGTSLADDSEEINLPADSVDLDSDPKSTSGHLVFLPQPSRLLLQLVGLVENALRRSSLLFSQLKVFWYDELAAMFARLEVECRRSSLSDNEMKRFIEWMGSRVMREFQEEFVVDNAGSSDCTIQLGLNDTEICEIALNVGPTFVRYTEATVAIAARPPLSSVAREHIARKPSAASALFEQSAPASPALVPAHLRLLSVVEAFKSNRCLDAMNALLGCPILLPTVPLNELKPPILVIISNCCIEAVNTFAEGIVLSSSTRSHPHRLLGHHLTSTLICRLVQIASLRCCLYALLLRRVKDATLTASAAEVPRPVYEALDTMTFDPTFVCTTGGHPISVKRFPIFVPSGGKKSTVGKCQKRPSRGAKGRPRKRICTKSLLDATEQDENGDCGEDEDEGENGVGVDPTSVDLEGGEVLEQTTAVNRLAGANTSRKSNALLSDPLLPSLTVCFRELDLSTILLGLQSPLQEPADFCWIDESSLLDSPLDAAVDVIYDVSGVKHFGREKSPDTPLNWITICYLLNELKLKVDHVFGVDLKSSAGWYAFERLNAMSPLLRHSYLMAIIPCLVRVVNSLIRHFKVPIYRSTLRSLHRDVTTVNFNLGLEVSNYKRILSNKWLIHEECRDDYCENDPFGLSRLTFNLTTRILADCLSSSLYCLTALSTGILPVVSALRSPEVLLSKTSTPSDSTCLSRLRYLAQCLDNSDVSESSLFDRHNLPTVSLLEDDVLGLAADASKQSETENEEPSATQVLRIIQWLMEFSPRGLAHTPSAFIHTCFVLSLARHLNNHLPAAESTAYEANLHLISTHPRTRLLFNIRLATAAYSHKDCLGALISLHLHSPFFGPSPSSLNECLEVLINLVKFNLLPLLQGRSRGNDEITQQSRLCYSGLTTQSAGLYGRKVLEAFCSCVRKLAKQTHAAASSRSVNLLNQWSACLEVLVCITEAVKGDTPSRAFFDLLPCLMRAGRMFVEQLLREAMPFLNAMFRSQGSAVLKFLRSVQQVTRFLQRTCVHAKSRREARLTPLIPQTRKCLETFVYSVKLCRGVMGLTNEAIIVAFFCMVLVQLVLPVPYSGELIAGSYWVWMWVYSFWRVSVGHHGTWFAAASISTGALVFCVLGMEPVQEHIGDNAVAGERHLLCVLDCLLLSQNHCADAFWLGNLKNRDLAGQEINDTDVSTRHSGRTTLSTASPLSSREGNTKAGSYTIEGAEELMSEEDSEVEEAGSSTDDAEEEEEEEEEEEDEN
ncbi:Fanconi anemia group D2 protein [Taenia solium]|eukprot:TsM_000255400 transcript=TsM_000255400 gene=TsM_000255400